MSELPEMSTAMKPNSADNSAPDAAGIFNVSGYRFLALEHLPVLQADLHTSLTGIGVLGTVLLADEGINIALSGTSTQVDAVESLLNADARFSGIWLKRSVSEFSPFSKLKVRIRHEIIAFDGSGAKTRQLSRPKAPYLLPEKLVEWLDNDRSLTLLDTRNHYEVKSGTFERATHLNIAHFRDFQSAIHQALEDGVLDRNKPVVTFCTGGIRCEKAAPWMLEQGFREVYQIDGGILNYLEKTGGAHWQGDCFVFDDRVELNKSLKPTGATWCTDCQLTVAPGETCTCRQTADCERTAADGGRMRQA